MDTENTVLTEQAEAEETSDAFDEGWADYDSDLTPGDGLGEQDDSDTDRDTEEEGEETEADADQQDAEGTEGDADGDASKGEAEGTEGTPDQDSSFTLRYLGEDKTVNREEVINLAQQGMDYSRIREKWDGIKDDVPRLRMYETFLKELAETRGGDIEALIDDVRTRSIMNQAKAEGKEIPAAEAARRAVTARLDAMKGDEAKKQADIEEEDRLRRRASVDRFYSVYGNSVKADEIPEEVWLDAEKTGDLTASYHKHRIGKLEEENKRLKEELEQTKQQQNNKARSMGSSRSVGSAAAKDAFDEGWDDAWT